MIICPKCAYPNDPGTVRCHVCEEPLSLSSPGAALAPVSTEPDLHPQASTSRRIVDKISSVTYLGIPAKERAHPVTPTPGPPPAPPVITRAAGAPPGMAPGVPSATCPS